MGSSIPIAWRVYKAKQKRSRRVLLPDCLPSQLPRIAFWNCSSLFCADPEIAAARLVHARELIRTSDLTILCEVHPKDNWASELGVEKTHSAWLSRASVNSRSSGGVVAVMSYSFAKKHRPSMNILWSGRMLEIALHFALCKIHVIGVHLTPVPPHSTWEQQIIALSAHVSRIPKSEPVIVIGDFNFIADPEDAIQAESGKIVGKPGWRAASWRRKFAAWSQLLGGFTFNHRASGQLRANDRVYTSLSLSVLSALGSKVAVCPALSFGASDHQSIILSFFLKDEGELYKTPTWPFECVEWERVLRGAAQEYQKTGCWIDDLKAIEAVIESARLEIVLAKDVVLEPPVVVHAIAINALRATLKGDAEKGFAGAARLGLTCSSPRALRVQLEKKVRAAYGEVLRAGCRYDPSSETSHQESRSLWYQSLWTAWRRSKMISSPLVVTEDSYESDAVHQAKALAKHWKPIFLGRETDAEVHSELETWLPEVPWSQISLQAEDFKAALCSASKSAPGRDGRVYASYVPIADAVSEVLVSVCEGLARGDRLPSSWFEAVLVFIPKRDRPVLWPSEFRPISLLNVMGKIFARALAYKLQSLICPCLHLGQKAFVPRKGTHEVLMDIEASSLALGAQASESCLTLLDVSQAFPSLSRKWLRRALLKTGCTGWVLNYLEQVLAPTCVFVSWQGRIYAKLDCESGVPQGHPLSAILFIFGVDAWVRRYAATIVPLAALALYADDVSCTHMCLADLAGMEAHLWVAQEGLGFEINWDKTCVIPLGPRISTWEAQFQEVFPETHPFRSMQVSEEARLLGYRVGRGDSLELASYALEKMRARVGQVMKIEAGAAMNRVLLSSVIYSCSAHALRSVSPTAEFARYWEWLQDCVHAAPRKWFNPYREHSRALFGLPDRVVGLDMFRDRLLTRMIKELAGVFWLPSQMISEWLEEPDRL